MPDEIYIVQEDDWLLKIAHSHGFDNERPLLDANPGLDQLVASNVDVLPVRYQLTIPQLKQQWQQASSDTVNYYTRKGWHKDLRLRVFHPLSHVLPNPLLFDGEKHEGWRCDLSVDGTVVLETGEPFQMTLHEIPWSATYQAALAFMGHDEHERLVETGRHTIDLMVGGLDPLIMDGKRRAVQKILTNLGFYQGPIDGDLSHARGAIRSFQQRVKVTTHGYADLVTCQALIQQQGNVIAYEAVETSSPAVEDRNLPLPSDEAESQESAVGATSSYREPTDNPTAALVVGAFTIFPPTAYVAPCDPGDSRKNLNVIRQRARRIIFLDTGRWLNVNRDFGVIWGRHAYLCNYSHTGFDKDRKTRGASSTDPVRAPHFSRRGLDAEFFEGFGAEVQIVKMATATWARDEDFNWDRLYVVIPDLHLLTNDREEVWRSGNAMRSETDLLRFALRLTEISALAGKVVFTQIGDSYDLWVGQPLLFKGNEQLRVELVDEPSDAAGTSQLRASAPNASNPAVLKELARMVDEIRGEDSGRSFQDHSSGWNWVHKAMEPQMASGELAGLEKLLWRDDRTDWWWNPAEVAFRLLEGKLSSDRRHSGKDIHPLTGASALGSSVGVYYIHGNHDNYLLRADVCEAAGLAARRAYLEGKGIFIEHAHRMEAQFGVGANYDGCVKGHAITNGVYEARFMAARHPSDLKKRVKGMAVDAGDKFSEWWAYVHDQQGYWDQFSRIAVARETHGKATSVPHIFVIGHTHKPRLEYIDISYDAPVTKILDRALSER